MAHAIRSLKSKCVDVCVYYDCFHKVHVILHDVVDHASYQLPRQVQIVRDKRSHSRPHGSATTSDCNPLD
jgi:hypothetical protein